MTNNQYEAIKNLILCFAFVLFGALSAGWFDVLYTILSVYTFICWWYFDYKVSKENSNDN